MKQTIVLTKEQIEQLTKASIERLKTEKAKKIEAIEAEFTKAVSALQNKFKTLDIPLDEETTNDKKSTGKRTLVKLDEKLIRQYYNESLSVKEMSEKIEGSKVSSIRQKLTSMGLLLKDQPKPAAK